MWGQVGACPERSRRNLSSGAKLRSGLKGASNRALFCVLSYNVCHEGCVGEFVVSHFQHAADWPPFCEFPAATTRLLPARWKAPLHFACHSSIGRACIYVAEANLPSLSATCNDAS